MPLSTDPINQSLVYQPFLENKVQRRRRDFEQIGKNSFLTLSNLALSALGGIGSYFLLNIAEIGKNVTPVPSELPEEASYLLLLNTGAVALGLLLGIGLGQKLKNKLPVEEAVGALNNRVPVELPGTNNEISPEIIDDGLKLDSPNPYEKLKAYVIQGTDQDSLHFHRAEFLEISESMKIPLYMIFSGADSSFYEQTKGLLLEQLPQNLYRSDDAISEAIKNVLSNLNLSNEFKNISASLALIIGDDLWIVIIGKNKVLYGSETAQVEEDLLASIQKFPLSGIKGTKARLILASDELWKLHITTILGKACHPYLEIDVIARELYAKVKSNKPLIMVVDLPRVDPPPTPKIPPRSAKQEEPKSVRGGGVFEEEELLKPKLELEGNIELLKEDPQVQIHIADINAASSKKETEAPISHLVEYIKPKLEKKEITNDGIVGIAKLIEDKKIQIRFIKAFDLIDDKDLVAMTSQGEFENGQFACAAICLKAATEFLNNPGTQPIKNQDDMDSIIDSGIKFYRENDFEGLVEFFDVMQKNGNSLRVSYPTKIEGFTDEGLKDISDSGTSLEGLQNQFSTVLKALDQFASEKGQKACGVLTYHGETVVIAFLQPNQPVLFDSHGRKYSEMDLGASVRSFDSCEELVKHIEANYFKEDVQEFHLMFLTKP